MATPHLCINITLETSTLGMLACLAEEEGKSVSGVAKELVVEALEWCEDRALSAVAAVRDINQAPRAAHRDVWK